MSNRNRRSAPTAITSEEPLPSGTAVVRWYANSYGWPLDKRNIIVEGELDQKYFRLAADL